MSRFELIGFVIWLSKSFSVCSSISVSLLFKSHNIGIKTWKCYSAKVLIGAFTDQAAHTICDVADRCAQCDRGGEGSLAAGCTMLVI